MQHFDSGEAVLFWHRQGSGGTIAGLGTAAEAIFGPPQVPFGYATRYGEPGFNTAMTSAYRNLDERMIPVSVEEREGNLRLVYESAEGAESRLRATVTVVREEGCSCFRQRVRMENIGDAPVTLTGLTSAMVSVFAYEGAFDGAETELWHCRQTWYGEGDWICQSFAEAGLVSTGVHVPETASFFLTALGTQTTAKFYPTLFVRDARRGETFFCELEPLGSWHLDVGLRRGWGQSRGCVELSAGCAEERRLRFAKTLRPGEAYESADCVYGIVSGGVEQALRELTRMRRRHRRKLPDEPLVFFNDYMNCLWADPDSERCLALARTAKAVGADVYVMDSGWFVGRGENWNCRLGDWATDSNRFAGGLSAFLAELRALGLRAGIWLELEVCGRDAAVHGMPEDWFVRRAGRRVGSGARRFFDFTNPQVRAYLRESVETLLRLGVSVIKNDYNDSYFAFEGEEGDLLQDNVKAFYSFFEELYADHPDLIVESCASGAMRSDGKTLSHFAFQSVSDQDDSLRYPAILKGSLLNILPEQLGVWCMPCPAACGEDTAAVKARPQELERTVWDVVNGLVGVFYLSGRIDCCDERNLALIREGIALAKRLSPVLRRSVPVYPAGLPGERRTPGSAAEGADGMRGWEALALADEAGAELLLYLWHRAGAPRTLTLAFNGLCEARQLYPASCLQAEVCCEGPRACFTFPDGDSARLFRLRLRGAGTESADPRK